MGTGTPKKTDLPKGPARLYEGIEYKEYWLSESRKRLDQLEQVLIRKALPESGRRIVDLGCGFGRLSGSYLDRFDQVIMLDGSVSLLQQAREETNRRATYIAADINSLPFADGSVDCILMIRVFHHINGSEELLQSFSNMLVNGGHLIFNFSNQLNPQAILRWLRGDRKNNPFTMPAIGKGSTFIQHNPRAVASMLKEAGFKPEERLGSGVFDKFPKLIRDPQKSFKLGLRTASSLGNSQVAPWLLTRSVRENKPASDWKSEIDQILVCPACRTSLQHHTDAYLCNACQIEYPIVEGIIDLRGPVE